MGAASEPYVNLRAGIPREPPLRESASEQARDYRRRCVVTASNARRKSNPIDYQDHLASLERLSKDPLMPAWRREELTGTLKIHAQLAGAIRVHRRGPLPARPQGGHRHGHAAAVKDEPLAEVELVPTDPKLRAKMSVNNRPLFRIVRQVPARYAAAVTFGSEAQRRRAHKKIRDWLRTKLDRDNAWTAEDRVCLL